MPAGIVRSIRMQIQFCTDDELLSLKESLEKKIADRALKGERHY